MKKLIYSALILFLCAFTLKAQDTWTTIYTPTGVAVEALDRVEFSQYELALVEQDAANWITEHKSNAVRIAPASRSYNCHSYAWHYSDGGSKVWVNQIARTNQANLSKYWTGSPQTYVSTNNIEGQKVFYPNGDHSARTTSTHGVFESKWGNGPTYRHAWNDCPYNSTGLQYFKVNMSGPEYLCNGSSGSFSTLNITNIAGSNYTWSGTNVTVNGTNSNATSTTNISYNGFGYVIANIYSPRSKTTVKSIKKIWIGAPSTPYDISGFPNNGIQFPSNSYLNFIVWTQPIEQGVNLFEWNVSGASILSGQGTPQIDVLTDNAINGNQWFGVNVRVGSACGWSPWLARVGTIYDSGAGGGSTYSIYPNPATTTVTVSVIESTTTASQGAEGIQTISSIKVFDKMGQLILARNYPNKPRVVQLNVSPLQKGIYLLKVNDAESHTLIKD